MVLVVTTAGAPRLDARVADPMPRCGLLSENIINVNKLLSFYLGKGNEVKVLLIHDLLFLPISTIESRVS